MQVVAHIELTASSEQEYQQLLTAVQANANVVNPIQDDLNMKVTVDLDFTTSYGQPS